MFENFEQVYLGCHDVGVRVWELWSGVRFLVWDYEVSNWDDSGIWAAG